jgi:hypothetical protein
VPLARTQIHLVSTDSCTRGYNITKIGRLRQAHQDEKLTGERTRLLELMIKLGATGRCAATPKRSSGGRSLPLHCLLRSTTQGTPYVRCAAGAAAETEIGRGERKRRGGRSVWSLSPPLKPGCVLFWVKLAILLRPCDDRFAIPRGLGKGLSSRVMVISFFLLNMDK